MPAQRKAKNSTDPSDVLSRILDKAKPPAGSSPQIIPAPAAGPSVRFRSLDVEMTGNGPRIRAVSQVGNHPVRRCPPLEVMERLSGRTGLKTSLRFSFAQHAAAVDYADLVALIDSVGVKLSSIDGGQGGPDPEGRTDRIIHAIGRLRAMNALLARIQTFDRALLAGHADRPRHQITGHAVLYAILIENRSVAGLLSRHGWSRQTPYVKAVHAALSASLDAIYGI